MRNGPQKNRSGKILKAAFLAAATFVWIGGATLFEPVGGAYKPVFSLLSLSNAYAQTPAGGGKSEPSHESHGIQENWTRGAVLPMQKPEQEASQKSGHTGAAEKGQPMAGAAGRTVDLTPEMERMSGVRTALVEYMRLAREIRTVGEITYDERRVKVASAWIGGRIDKLYVDFTGVVVEKGAPLVEMYSPELVTTLREYLLALETRGRIWAGRNEEATSSANDLVDATRKRLLLWGITEKQLDKIARTREISTEMTIFAPIGGTVIHKKVNEGQYVKTGEELYTIADLSSVWAMVDVYENDIALVKLGQKVAVTAPAYPGETFTGMVSFIEPFLNTKTRSVKVRMDVPNPALELKPGMYVDALVKIPYRQEKLVLAVPRTAVLDTGVRNLVFVEIKPGEYKPIEVKVGPRAGDYVPILSGLEQGQRVAISANYLLDSQSTLSAGASEGYGGAIGGHKGH